ncbi:MAG: hypothetical protein OXL96_13990 [Candidatus Poribacteria bacterium]|nr:hypothetical protein [Candidatus Poribacteria bacterium]
MTPLLLKLAIDNEIWKLTRKVFLDYREVKRKLRAIIKEHDRASHRFERAVIKFIEAQVEALKKVDDDRTESLAQAHNFLKQRKREYKESYEAYSDTLKEFRDAEVNYCVTVFKVLRDFEGIPLTNLSTAFGIWDSNIDRWITEGADADKLGALYDEEFGELSRLQGSDDEESS